MRIPQAVAMKLSQTDGRERKYRSRTKLLGISEIDKYLTQRGETGACIPKIMYVTKKVDSTMLY